MARDVERYLKGETVEACPPSVGYKLRTFVRRHRAGVSVTGTVVMLELEAMGLDRVRTEVSVQYVDHNLLQADERNAGDH